LKKKVIFRHTDLYKNKGQKLGYKATPEHIYLKRTCRVCD